MNTALKVLLGTALVGGLGYAATKVIKAKKAKKRNGRAKSTKTTDVSALDGIYEGGAILTPVVFDDFHPDLQAQGGSEEYVISLTPDAQHLAYEYMLHLIRNKGMDVLNKQTDREEAVILTLNQLAPDADFAQGLSSYIYESPHWWAWTGVSTLGELAHINLDAKGVLGMSPGGPNLTIQQ